MGRTTIFFLALACLATVILARKGFGPGEQEWGYVPVRPNAVMFWWLYYTTANVPSYTKRPLIIWLQGGPGASSTSFGNFDELGPVDVNLQPRNHTWVKDYNVMFIDNPVGTGYSYTTDQSGYATTNAQVATDLVECIRQFLTQFPAFSNVPTYIATESYGGKMGTEFALVWYKEQQARRIKSNLKGLAIGDGWVSPIDSVMTWASYLFNAGIVDTNGYDEINKAALLTKQAVDARQWTRAADLWSYTEGVISKVGHNVDFYNILTEIRGRPQQYSGLSEVPLTPTTNVDREAVFRTYIESTPLSIESLMNGPVKEALGLASTHGLQSSTVFSMLWGDFMKPVVDKVELLLNGTNMNVVVLSGNLDLIVDTPGTLRWVENLRWKDAMNWHKANRLPVIVNNVIEGYVKSYRNLAMFWVNRAGHNVPRDNPAAMSQILQHLTSNA